MQHSDSEGVLAAEGKGRSYRSAAEDEDQEGDGGLQQMEDSEPDSDILLEDDQVADFVGSVLAAISCWNDRAQALLSTGVTMVTVRTA